MDKHLLLKEVCMIPCQPGAGFDNISEMKLIKIYVLRDPVSLEVRYVGQTGQTLLNRLKGHIADSKRRPDNPKAQWINSVKTYGQNLLIELLEEAVIEREDFWIQKYRDEGSRLFNIIKGGTCGPIGLKKTHCPQGHPYDEANTSIDKYGKRGCRECTRKASRENQRVRRAQMKTSGLTCRGRSLERVFCRAGKHSWIDENIFVYPNGIKTCRLCKTEKEKENLPSRRQRYATDPEYRERVKAAARKSMSKHAQKQN